jgi:hypothetical protein
MRRKKTFRFFGVVLAALVLSIPIGVQAATVFETTGFITGVEGVSHPFTADIGPFNYKATLTDLSSTPLSFNSLYLSITTASDILVPFTKITNSGSFLFNAIVGNTYFAHVFGQGGGPFETGLYGLKVESVPIPASIVLLGSVLLGFIGIRRRGRQ